MSNPPRSIRARSLDFIFNSVDALPGCFVLWLVLSIGHWIITGVQWSPLINRSGIGLWAMCVLGNAIKAVRNG